MSRLRNRLEYLDSYSPSEASELLRGARYSDFLSLPNKFGDLSGRAPTTYMSAFFDKLSDFESKEKDKGTHFERFLALQNNPDSLVQKTVKLPTGFNQAYGMTQGFGA
jgi:hypothetical protein